MGKPLSEKQTSVLRQHAFKPGQTGNRGGRPKGLAAKVRELTNDCQEPVEFMLKVLRGEVPASIREKSDAAKWLVERGAGKAAEVILQGELEAEATAHALDGLTVEDLRTLARQTGPLFDGLSSPLVVDESEAE